MVRSSFLSIADLTPAEVSALLDTAVAQKAAPNGAHRDALRGQAVALLFQKPSLRTRVSLDLAVQRLGGWSLYLSPPAAGLGEREPAQDVARVLSGYCQAIVCRTFPHAVPQELARSPPAPAILAPSPVPPQRFRPAPLPLIAPGLRPRWVLVGGQRLNFGAVGNEGGPDPRRWYRYRGG